MAVARIIFLSLGGLLLAVSFCGSLIIANIDKPGKCVKRFYCWSFLIGVISLFIAILMFL